MPISRPVVLWFRDDRRLADHAGLAAAMATGQPVLPVYVLDDETPGRWRMGGAARWWLHHSLVSLAADLRQAGAPLVLRRGDARAVIPALVAETSATAIYTAGSVDPWARTVDKAMAEETGVPFHRMRTTLLFNPDRIRTGGGTPYGVYTPFSRACLETGGPPAPVPAPARIPGARPVRSERLDAWGLLPRHPDWAGGLRARWSPGEAGVRALLAMFLRDRLAQYAAQRDVPSVEATSLLSPHLHHGEISPATVWHAAMAAEPSAARDRFIRELLWREFAHHLLWHHPSMPDEPLRATFARMPWREDPAALRAWQRGRTGIPVVDAGMRQLWHTGWMHNRVRMIVASFLTKHLLLRWQDGEAWFWDTLVDADAANNAASWQWVAGSGADAAPFFRVFNPVLQGVKFDPDGAYVRRFVPELARLDAKYIHAPWQAPAPALHQAGVTLGRDYPHPIVDLPAGRARALAAYQTIRLEPGSRDAADYR